MEEKRPGQYFPIGEDENGSYLLNAKDLCMLEHIDKLAKAGVDSFKIEGRAKSSYYVSVVANAYRVAIDDYQQAPDQFSLRPWLLEEVKKVSHRRYSTGFYFDTPDQYPENGGYERAFDVVAIVDGTEEDRLLLTQKNKFSRGDTVEILAPGEKPCVLKVTELQNGEGMPIEAACHPLEKLRIRCDKAFPPGSIVRKEKE